MRDFTSGQLSKIVIEAFILGLVEGLTEFLPVSSTGHLIVVSDWLGLKQTDSHMAFEVIIQVAAILAIVANYFEKFALKYWNLWVNVGVSILPICLIGFLFHDDIKTWFNVETVAWAFIIGGVIFLLTEWFLSSQIGKEDFQKIKRMEDINRWEAMFIGFWQAFALIPGTSRAGASIIGALYIKLDRKTAAEYSFLMALPVLALAAGHDLFKYHETLFSDVNQANLLIGFAVAFVAAYFTMRVFISYLQRFTFTVFGVYRILFGIGLLWWSIQ